MPGPITYTAVALMARDRVRHIQRALLSKKANGRRFTDVEKQLLYLAEQTLQITDKAPAGIEPPVALYGPARGDQLSKFLLMGAIGPALPGYAALFADNQSWLRDTLYKGTPDNNREQVLADSCNLPLAFWRKVEPLLAQEFGDERERNAARLGMQSYVLGHFSHIATDLVAPPFIDNLAWRPGRTAAPQLAKLSRQQVVGAVEAEVARTLFGRGSRTRGGDWIDWFPTPGQVPDAFYSAFKQALEELYGPGAVRSGGPGYQKRRADAAAPPPLSEALLKDGYSSFRTVMDTGTAWDYWDWLGATWFMFVPALLAYPMALALPNGKHYFADEKPEGYSGDAALFELVNLPFAMNSLVALFYSITATTSYLGTESEVIVGWVSAAVQLLAAIFFFATLGAGGDGLGARWALLFGLPLVMEVIHIVVTALKGAANPRRMQLLVSTLLPMGLSLAFIGLYWGFMHTGIEKIGSEPGEFVWQLVVWSLLLFFLWWMTALLLRFVASRSLPNDVANARVSQQRHALRLFDDGSLLHTPAGTPPTLADLHYPSGRRELLKLWWDGGGNATVRSLRDRIEFIVDGTTTLVPVPDAPMTVSEFAAHLQRSVKNAGGQTGLKAELFFTGADSLEDHELAPGSVFADEGDALDPDLDTTLTEEAYTAQAAVAKPLGPSTGDPYVLFHAHKAQQAVRFDQNGATLDADELTPQFDGIGGVASLAGTHTVTLAPGPGVSRFTRVFRAGDLIEVPQGGLRRVVVSVDSDFSLTVATPFPAAVPAGSTYRRVALDHRAPLLPPAGAQVMTPVDAFGSPIPDQLAVAPGPAVAFGAMFRPGDSIRVHLVPGNLALDQTRVVVDVLSDGVLLLGREFDPTNPAAVGPFGFERIGREPEHLFGFLATGDDTLDSGQTLMNHAADLAAMLCLSATSQMLAPDALAAARVGSTGDLKRVVQVLRNWNLDRRRQNEWKMLVQGGALSEKRGDASALDPALPPLPAGWSLLAGEGEATSNSLGWVNLLRSWVDMARRPESDALADTSFRPGAPSNKALSQAMAYLFDMPDPVA